jgi:D-erythronate 2-dehydrogenase
MPALTMTIGGMVASLERVAGPQVSALIDWVPDPLIARLFASWPGRIRADRAGRLGLTPDPDFDGVIRSHLAETQPTSGQRP